MAYPPKKSEPEFATISDFDPNVLLQAQGQHEKSIGDLAERVGKIEASLATPQALAVFLEEAAKDSRQLEAVFAKMFCRFMQENSDVQTAVKKKMDEVDRNFFYRNFKRIWFPLYSGLLIFLTLLGKHLMEWLISLIPLK
jgi:hypothetical protein